MIGIGAGPATDGQVLVFHDLLGITTGRRAQVRQALRRCALRDESLRGVRDYADEVRAGRFPDPEQHTYSIDPEELEAFKALPLGRRASRAFGGDWSATGRW